ncbi:pectate lyase [Arsukibacterium ikkense]|uniref:pectate lyase n=1 Tax=Arsukibacterium ikkense TaxID=336831 RepID=UPI0009FCB734|nr:pectate lyase [Arsukibacterium ikkense]
MPTFDNSATSTQLQVLARAYSATGSADYAEAFYRGLQLIFQAQYPNGGWPQSYPLRGGYHDHITLNDEVTADILNLLLDVSQQTGDYAFVSEAVRQQARQHFERGIALLLLLQVDTGQGLTLWAAQYQHRTLEPDSAGTAAQAWQPPDLATVCRNRLQ